MAQHFYAKDNFAVALWVDQYILGYYSLNMGQPSSKVTALSFSLYHDAIMYDSLRLV